MLLCQMPDGDLTAPTLPRGEERCDPWDGCRAGRESGSRWLSWWPGWVDRAPVWPCSSAPAQRAWRGPCHLSLSPAPSDPLHSCCPVTGSLRKHASVPDGHQAPCWPRKQQDKMPVCPQDARGLEGNTQAYEALPGPSVIQGGGENRRHPETRAGFPWGQEGLPSVASDVGKEPAE